MKSMILNIGDELLIGQVVNTNASYIAKILNTYHVTVELIEVVSDNKEEILQSLIKGLHYDLVIITGGLGPTKDDITKHTLAEFMNDTLVENEIVLNDIKNLVESRKRTMNELNRQQALVLSKADIIRNFLGTAPGMIMKKDNTVYVSLPGVPYEMKPMLQEFVQKYVVTKWKGQIIHKSVFVFGIPESELSVKIEKWENALNKDGIKLAYLPNRNLIRLRLTSVNIEDAENKIQNHIQELKSILNKNFVGEEDWNDTSDYPLAKVVVQILQQQQLTISFAESCTGGSISSMITKIPGASDVFYGSVVSYSNEIKIKVLGVKENTLKQYGAVSKECVEEMAIGIKNLMKTDIAISVSGIAGPTGGTSEKPVGTVWMALCFHDKVESKLFQFGEQSREQIIESATFNALSWVLKKLIEL
ncbi:MAG: competence/damage-inducible protein A [Bacteroidia bacterium]|nr:competence/damage-inducible protein A [Bacteroidia bacterium]